MHIWSVYFRASFPSLVPRTVRMPEAAERASSTNPFIARGSSSASASSTPTGSADCLTVWRTPAAVGWLAISAPPGPNSDTMNFINSVLPVP